MSKPTTGPALFEPLCRKLAAAGFKLTGPRKVLLRYFTEVCPHKTAEDIYLDLRPQGLGRATVFRALKIFVDAGVVEKCVMGGKAGFELSSCSEGGHHHHMLCVKCGCVIEFSSPAMEALQDAETRRHGFTPLAHSFEIRGLCRKCKTGKRNAG